MCSCAPPSSSPASTSRTSTPSSSTAPTPSDSPSYTSFVAVSDAAPVAPTPTSSFPSTVASLRRPKSASKTMLAATELGAGFQIAMKDLEIRGAGNILGANQSGHIYAVGFDLYTRLLSDAVESLRAQRASQSHSEEGGGLTPAPRTQHPEPSLPALRSTSASRQTSPPTTSPTCPRASTSTAAS